MRELLVLFGIGSLLLSNLTLMAKKKPKKKKKTRRGSRKGIM
jgi:hypothetical protein